MTVLQVADLRFGYAGDTLFEGVTFSLSIGDRVALVAPNGSGKTTLLRILAGEIDADRGSSVLRRDATLGFYRQSHEIAAEGDVLGAFMAGFRRSGRAARRAATGAIRGGQRRGRGAGSSR
jgi:ATP-binding cassette subfamily F protein 3